MNIIFNSKGKNILKSLWLILPIVFQKFASICTALYKGVFYPLIELTVITIFIFYNLFYFFKNPSLLNFCLFLTTLILAILYVYFLILLTIFFLIFFWCFTLFVIYCAFYVGRLKNFVTHVFTFLFFITSFSFGGNYIIWIMQMLIIYLSSTSFSVASTDVFLFLLALIIMLLLMASLYVWHCLKCLLYYITWSSWNPRGRSYY